MQRRPTNRFWNAYGALYGDLKLKPSPSKGQAKKTSPRAFKSEFEEQIIAATWLDKNRVIFYHIPNGGRRSLAEGVKFKRMGVKAGVPDICIPIARSPYHGLYIELKRKDGGKLSDSQKYWVEELRRQGYDVYEAHGADDLIEYVRRYLRI